MEKSSFPIQTEKQNNTDIKFDKEILENIFCPKCLKFPEYSIKLSSKSFSLKHSCLKGKMIEKPFAPKQENSQLIFKCHYCLKNCVRMCINCKYTICEECFKEHNKQNLIQTIQIPSDDGEIDILFMDIINCQYFCDAHLLKYEYYCPVCKINLCQSCNEEHMHINCDNLLSQNIQLNDIVESENDFFKNICSVANIFHSCYIQSLTNSKMTLNIFLNNILSKKIIEFIQEDKIPPKEIEIKNDYLNNININSYICQKYDDDEFNKYYSNLISNASDGNISQYYKLNEIKKMYQSDKFPKLFRIINFRNILRLKIENAISSFYLVEAEFNINDLNLTLSKCLKKIDELKLKNELNEYSLQLLHMFSLKMNYKLDFELRRKIGNILGKEILTKFHENLNSIKPTKYLYTLSNENIAEKLSKEMNGNKSNSKDSNTKRFKDLKEKYILSLNNLIDKARDEIDKFDIESSKSNRNVITFKNLNNNKEEIKKAIICNLFFYIKTKFDDEFNDQIHNKSHSINSLTVDTLRKVEHKEEEKNMEDKDKSNSKDKKEKIGTQKNDQKGKEDQNQIITDNINKTCQNKFIVIKKLNSEIKVEEQKMPSEPIYNYSLDQDESIINSSVNEFAKILQEMKSSYLISFNISLFDSLNLYLDGKKAKIIEKEFSSSNIKKLIKECSENASEGNKLNEINNFCENFKESLDSNLDFLFGYLKNTAEKLEEIAQYLDIKALLTKYKISQPLSPKKEMKKIQMSNFNRTEEKYCLILVFSYFYVISNIKALNKIKNNFEQINLEEVTKINIIKENLISKYVKDTIKLDEDITPDVWNKVKNCKKFVDDEAMNKLIVNYVNGKQKEDYKNDLFNLLKSFITNINLNSRDPQNIILDSFMRQENLLD